jgi:hypothetical protein
VTVKIASNKGSKRSIFCSAIEYVPTIVDEKKLIALRLCERKTMYERKKRLRC